MKKRFVKSLKQYAGPVELEAEKINAALEKWIFGRKLSKPASRKSHTKSHTARQRARKDAK